MQLVCGRVFCGFEETLYFLKVGVEVEGEGMGGEGMGRLLCLALPHILDLLVCVAHKGSAARTDQRITDSQCASHKYHGSNASLGGQCVWLFRWDKVNGKS